MSEESSGTDPDVTASADEPLPDRVPPEPFVLPAGCGDGIAVSGQYDCHYPVLLSYLKEAMGADSSPSRFIGWDMDGDGRDELIALTPTPGLLAATRWSGERFDAATPVMVQVAPLHWTTHFDVDRDGRADLIKLSNTLMAYHRVTPSFELEDENIPALFDVPVLGQVGPVDLDADGELEALMVREPEPTTLPDLFLHRNVGGMWQPVGQALGLPGCPSAARFEWADFDGDGYDDVAILNHPSACDPFPLDYDPAWHSISIYFHEPVTHTLVPGPVVPAGAITNHELLMLGDFDGDGELDILVGLGESSSQKMIGTALVHGHGDGSFDEGVPLDLPGIPEWKLQGTGDLDGDGDLDWILKGDAVVDDIFADQPEIVHVRSDVIGIDGEPWANVEALGDFNGDGVIDYVGSKRFGSGDFVPIAMLSAP